MDKGRKRSESRETSNGTGLGSVMGTVMLQLTGKNSQKRVWGGSQFLSRV